ncbi:hypothetical protein OPV22_009780 [Ensete ventricosum]|uniref:Uncharacterized protein n=1 Tax=Ensete ventricosum TaxID=4639 RepID=A0AAV8RJN4_ENSVE|nr:hypothetical protein OPV22_009780 [Ensete ventricosum]
MALFSLSLLYSFAKNTNSRKEAIVYLRTERDERKEEICCGSSDGDGATSEWNVETRGEEGQRWLRGAMKLAWPAGFAELGNPRCEIWAKPLFCVSFLLRRNEKRSFYQMIGYPPTLPPLP